MDLKRSLEAVNAMYALEPELRDIYVEGWSDKHFIEWYLEKKGIDNITVYPIEFVDIQDEILVKHKLSLCSNRSSIIALSCELNINHGGKGKVICLVDRDFEDICPSGHINPYLTFTDGHSLELYSFSKSVIRKFLSVALGGFPLSVEKFTSVTSKILERIFAIRLTNERLGWGMTWLPFAKYLNVSKDSITFREADFVKAYLLKNNQWNHKSEFDKAFAETLELLPSDICKKIRGHDLADFILILTKKLKKDREYGNRETIEGCLMATIETADLENYSLFKKVETLSQ